ncbi:MAG: SUF system NifU family Fe-S cluster assembly protein [Candidatus Thermoplasmatota archaeon]|nr:SUF system NifU family Fe-S cluster assembly protein [Candidatus Thermoplasmatota archaeon]
MTDFGDLYMEVILDHNKNPRNKGEIEDHTNHADGHNPLCGDKISLDIIIEDEIVKEIKFTGSGCAISTASSSILTEYIVGKKIDEIRHLFEEFHDLVTTESSESKNLGKLSVFEGVKKYPARVKCATLAWHTLIAAIDGEGEVSTE